MERAASRSDENLRRTILVPPIWWIWTTTPVALLAVLAAVLAPMDVFGRVLWLALAVGCQGLPAAARRNRVVVEGNQLAVRGVFAWRRVSLHLLTEARVSPRQKRLWLIDANGNRLPLSLNGYPPRDRARVLKAIEPFVMRDRVHPTGRVRQALTGTIWWPRQRRS